MLLRLLSLCAFAFAFVVNPLYLVAGCMSDSSSHYEYGEAEMLALLQNGSSTIHHFKHNGYDYELTLVARESGGADAGLSAQQPLSWQTQAHACGHRTFQASAAACIDISDMVVQGALTLKLLKATGTQTLVDAVPVSGDLMIPGTSLRFGQLSLATGTLALRATFNQVDTTSELVLAELVWDGGGNSSQAVSYQQP